MKRALTFVLCVVLCACERPASNDAPPPANATTATAATPAPEPVQTTPVDLTQEQLLADPPVNWQQIFQSDRPGGRMAEFIPDDSPADGWKEKLVFESFTGDPLPQPGELIGQIAADQQATCEKLTDTQTFSGVENGYPTSVHLLVCYVNKLTNQGQVTLIKAIRGDAHFYTVTLAARTQAMELDNELPLPPAIVAEWAAYLSAISVCNPSAVAHPCPSAPEPAPESGGAQNRSAASEVTAPDGAAMD